MINLKEIGKRCQTYRKSISILQTQVAEETGYSTENVSAFENGRNDNIRIFSWYLLRGLDARKTLSDCED